MTEQANFTLRGRNPDILTCIANLSSDEVFTPPGLASQMLDMIAETWSDNHNGENIWANKSVTFLDPCTKSGVFLREITKRLTEGLKESIPDLQERVNHILSRQVFGVGITRITSLLARRSLYCSKIANGEHSIATSFGDEDGNIWFKRIEHSWESSKCRYCNAPKMILDRNADVENYAYPFIHTGEIKTWMVETFGGNVQFDVVIGNPPYQMKGGAGGSSDSSIYHLFVEQAKNLEPKYLSMVIPSRWLAGGRGMDEFRKEMLGSNKLVGLVDYPVSSEVFPGVEVKGGVCYFVWDSSHEGMCQVTVVRGEDRQTSTRKLDEFDVFVRDPRAVDILKKVVIPGHVGMDVLVSNREPFKLESNFDGFHLKKGDKDIDLHYIRNGKRSIGYIRENSITKNRDLINRWKLLVPKAGSDGGQKIPDSVLGKPLVSRPPSACTGSYLVIPANSKSEALSIESYYRTRFFRFMVSLRKITQDAFSHMYEWVPQQSWDREWTDKELFKKYKLTKEEIEYVEAMIRPMEADDE